jgi:capsular exopolysaccharide synthesis family protein
MSRIDEALARARTADPEQLAPPASRPMPDGGIEFPVEAEEQPLPPLVTDLSVGGPPASPAPVPTDAVVEAEGDVASLPGAEKLMLQNGEATSVEQYRRLAARLLMAQADRGTRLVMITSAFPAEGKTLTSANLALTLSESYKRKVLLIDGDLRRPSIHTLFRVPNVTGLNDGLQIEGDRKIPVLHYTDNLSILTAGRPDTDPMSVLSGERMRRVLDEAKQQFDWVIVDTPPVALLSDAHLLSGLVDAVLLVVHSGKTPLPALHTAIEAVGRERILGVVLNRTDVRMAGAAYDYYGYYGNYPARQSE